MNKVQTVLKKLSIWVIFFLPVGVFSLAGYLVMNPRLEKADSTNLGRLIEPVQSVTQLDIDLHNETWQLVILIDNTCDSACNTRLQVVRDVHWALGQEAHRVVRTALVLDGELDNATRAQFPDMRFVYLPEQDFVQWSEQSVGLSKPYHLGVMVVDPLGYAFMYYDQQHTGNNMIIDLRKLLRYSSLG